MNAFGPSLMPWPARMRRAFPWALTGLGATALALPVLPVAAAVSVTRSAQADVSASVRAQRASVALALVAGGVIAGRVLSRRSANRMRDIRRRIDPGLREAPDNPHVSSGPGSLITSAELGREGARFVGTGTTGEDVAYVTGQKRICAPIRVFVGVDAADTIEQRVGLAIAELRRTGAFERTCVVVQSPAGTGYANPTAVNAVELLTRGDCASVVVGYGLMPSFLSLSSIDIARRTQEALLAAIAAECAVRDRSPRLLLYGESLGARVQQAALPNGIADMDRLGIDTAVWVGTPGGRDYDAAHLAFSPVAITIDNPSQIPARLSRFAGKHPRVWFLEHDADPVVRFRPELVRRRPDWLPSVGQRGRGIPAKMRWLPVITWAQVLVDTMYATDVTPGEFRSAGHDYRADLGVVITRAYGLETYSGAERLEEGLRAIEIRRAARIEGVQPGAATLGGASPA